MLKVTIKIKAAKWEIQARRLIGAQIFSTCTLLFLSQFLLEIKELIRVICKVGKTRV